MDKKNILVICGSTRTQSANLNLIKAIEHLSVNVFHMHLFKNLCAIPAFNPDLDNENVPESVNEFRELIKAADAVLICSPEYALGVPGVLKNAIDWTVSSMEFSGKPLALITASTSGTKAHRSLLDTLLVIEAKITSETHLLISSIKSKVTSEGRLTDEQTGRNLRQLIMVLTKVVDDQEKVLSYLPAPDLN